ncbi:MAG TPA: class I SAM-dependent methyltransferase [Anaerolineaceae bacterium]|nr:class I SAM-dependent methyltransferase [Anaerolineaceae bacterium]HPN50302.1 class I SAM-dependent methyltransferase [Anaerolineaceae bacterium]
MPSSASIWNERYQLDWYSKLTTPRRLLVEHAHLLPPGGVAFEAAMGMGGSAGFLLSRKFKVLGVDFSEVAVRQVHRRLPALWAVVADLDHFYLPPAYFDVIDNFYYLNRALWPKYHAALKPGGLIFFETLTKQMRQEKPGLSPESLLDPGELKDAFSTHWDIIHYHEGWMESERGGQKAVASLVARKKE